VQALQSARRAHTQAGCTKELSTAWYEKVGSTSLRSGGSTPTGSLRHRSSRHRTSFRSQREWMRVTMRSAATLDTWQVASTARKMAPVLKFMLRACL
jgi:hypothetical protein